MQSLNLHPDPGQLRSLDGIKIVEASAILIQKNVRGWLCRLRLGKFLDQLLENGLEVQPDTDIEEGDEFDDI